MVVGRSHGTRRERLDGNEEEARVSDTFFPFCRMEKEMKVVSCVCEGGELCVVSEWKDDE